MSEQALALVHEGAAHSAAGRLEAAIGAYRRALAMAPDLAAAHCNLGIALARRGQTNDALAAYQRAVELAPGAAAGHYNLALLQHGAGRYGQAEAALRRALACQPDLAAAHSALAETLVALGRTDDAAESCRQALALKPEHPGYRLNLAQVLERLEQSEAALTETEAVLARHPTALPALLVKARLCAALGHSEAAAETTRQALALAPDDLEALRALSRVHGEAAETAYEAALARTPAFAEAACDLAELRLARGDAQGALDACEACLRAVPGQTRALAITCVALSELGERDQLARLTSMDLLVQQRRWRQTPGGGDLAALNQALAAHILAHPSLYREPRETATRLGRHSGELLIEPKGPVAQLEAMICRAVEDYANAHTANPFATLPAPVPERWSLNVWAVVLEAAGHQAPHIHPSAWLSGVYYVQLPELAAEGGQAGWIEFGQALEHQRTTRPLPTTALRPETGLMVLFPSYFFHRTLPFDGDGTRISVAFDVIPETGRR